MIFNTTYNNQDFEDQSTLSVGKKFDLLERIKLGGIGSGRFVIGHMSDKLNLGKLNFSETDYGNIELRPNGIIIHYTKKLERFSWIIPFYRLVIYSTTFFSVHADGSFIQFLKNKNYNDNKEFIKKMVSAKNNFLNLEYYDY